ncbi:GNAT family N-acetyltransferase [Mycolicibacterium wolinskyi]|uniref:GCN5 family acetyltransferase n=1 Tax=Mycolicibacterium wolinskyi TaxID=59750 RepID=A0A1X2F691_9MYCO|nr:MULTISPECIES: GNAT family N-acetyltransferase [Mycolicibacterium]MCV7284072.1 GNAT family N-acetyltransferase [Mycolicibacterium wolinskyi]MCV7293908.1 GNAT family N-acetyltransferase [Mycolicibacterium goodii]ORX13924.1 GCN5 family acetyltransferase [Mycolicibacterium wolinskyi]
MRYRVIRLTEADWRLFAVLRLRALADSLGVDDQHYRRESRFTAAQWRRRLRDHAQFTAAVDGRAVGLIGAQQQNADTMYLYSLWVDPAARGHGLAHRLIGAAVDWSRGRRVQTVKLRVATDNAAARCVYESLGFDVADAESSAGAKELAMTLRVS